MDVLPDRLPVPRSRARTRSPASAWPCARRRRARTDACDCARTAIPLGPRTSHDPARGDRDAARLPQLGRAPAAPGAAPSPAIPAGARSGASSGCSSGSRSPASGAMGRYDLLVTLGRLGLYELQADSLHLGGRAAGCPERPHHAGRQAPVRDRRSDAPRAPRRRRSRRRSRCRWRRSTWRSPTGPRRSGPRSAARPTPAIAGTLERAAGARLRPRAVRRKMPSTPPPTVTAVSCFPSARESRCHSASSSLRMPFE